MLPLLFSGAVGVLVWLRAATAGVCFCLLQGVSGVPQLLLLVPRFRGAACFGFWCWVGGSSFICFLCFVFLFVSCVSVSVSVSAYVVIPVTVLFFFLPLAYLMLVVMGVNKV
jgi:hypothetical protein